MPYRKILLCADNSEHSGHAAGHAGALARAFGSAVTAVHVYAARLHDRRFADLEPGLPGEYRDPKRLEASRRTHDSLIGRGLRLISDSYLAAVRAKLEGVPLDAKSIEGKNYVELVRELADGYGLAVIGACGLGLASMNGRHADEALGSVCERFLRRARTDVLIAKDARSPSGTIVAGVDGSSESYAALRRALKIARTFGGRVEAVACFDPSFHPVAFRSISEVLSEEDSKLFRFREQEKLHEEVINRGLENLYRGYLDNARAVAAGRGQEAQTRLLTGRPACEIASRARETDASLVVVARFGLHRTPDLDIGGTAERVARLTPSNVLVVNEEPEGEVSWTPEAEVRLERVPEFMRPMVRKAVESHARARGVVVITPEVVTEAKTGHGVPLPGHGKA